MAGIGIRHKIVVVIGHLFDLFHVHHTNRITGHDTKSRYYGSSTTLIPAKRACRIVRTMPYNVIDIIVPDNEFDFCCQR